MKQIFLLTPIVLCAVIANAQDTTTKKAPVVQKIIVADPPPTVYQLRVADPGQKVAQDPSAFPRFPGGPDSLRKFVKANFKLPLNAPDIRNLEVVTFYVETDGSLSNIHITKGISPELDKEAIRVMGLGPKWEPALKDNKPVRTLFSIPIRFPLGS